MKYCPYCGAAIIDSAASFCMECGIKLPNAAGYAAVTGNGHPAYPSARKSATQSEKRNYKKPHRPRPVYEPGPGRKPKPDIRDEGYDGYYDDIKPVDDGYAREHRDTELIKRVVLLASGALVIVVFTVILMYML